MGEIIRDKRQTPSIEKNAWDSLAHYSEFKKHAINHLSDDTKKWLDEELEGIKEYEEEDLIYPKSSNRPHHTKAEYDKFRQEKIDKAISEDLSRLDAKTLSDLEADFASIDEDERKDYANPHAISNRHTREEYNKFREEAVAKAFRKIGQKVEQAVVQPESKFEPKSQLEPQSQVETQPEPDSTPELNPKSGPILEPPIPEPEKPRPTTADKAANTAKDKSKIIAKDKAEAKARDKAEAMARDRKEAMEEARKLAQSKSRVEENQPSTNTNPAEQVRFKTKEELEHEIARVKSELAAEKAEIDELKHQRILFAINADFTHDKKELAKDYAERELNAELAKSAFIKRLWKGDLFKKYYWKKYEKAIYSGERKIHLNGESLELDAIIEKRSRDAIDRFVYGVMDDPETSRYIHRAIGDEDGEKLSEADEETTERVKSTIKEIVKGIKPGLSSKEFARQFQEKLKQTEAEARDKKDTKHNLALYNNYAEVAFTAYQLASQHESLNRVMEGFKVYNADVRNNQRTQIHRDGIDKLIDKVESHKIGQFIPTEVIAAAAGSAISLTRIGTGAVLGLGAGLGFAGAFAGIRERNRIAEDRTRIIRDTAEGLIYDSPNAVESLKGFKKIAAKNRARYEAKIGGTIYSIRPASSLIKNLDDAIKNGDKDAILQSIAEIKVRIDYSDSEQKDLISYSSADAMGRERMELDAIVIKAKNILPEYASKRLNTIERVIQRRIDEEVKESDRDFRRIRTLRSLKRTGTTIALGAIFSLTAQELAAIISPNKIGIFEKAGLIHNQNNSNATETMLARLTGPRTYTDEITGIIEGTEEQYRQAGFEITKTNNAYVEDLPTTTESVGINEVFSINNVKIDWANNSTAYADGNELGLHIDNAQGVFRTNISGTSSLPSGEIIDVASAVRSGNAQLVIEVGGKTLAVPATAIDQAGQAVFGQNGYVQTTNGYLLRIIGDNGERLFDSAHLAIDNGVGPDMAQHFTYIATAPGDGTVGSIFRSVPHSIRHPATFTATRSYNVQSEAFGSGFISPMTTRTGLGTATQSPETRNEYNVL